jgi:outer membrane receptor protein involved in Fe transport
LSAGCREYVTRENNNLNTIIQKNVEGTLQGKIITLPAGDLRFAFGGDYRGSSFDYHPDSGLINNDSFSYDTTVATSGTQNVREVFAELLVPVLKDLPLIEELSLDLGARRSDYDGFGGVNTWKADMNWKPVSTVSVRGGYARAIRAPSLGELFAPTVTGNLNIGSGPAAGDPCATGSSFRTGATAAQVAALCQAQGVPAALYPNYTYGVDSVHGTSGGNPNLTPETADTYSIGTVWSPHFSSDLMHKFQVSVDYYHIAISNAVGSLALTDILPRCFNSDGVSNPTYSATNIYCSQITRDRSTGNIVLGHEGLLNLASYKTDGIDTEIDWSFGLGALGLSDSAGTFRLNSMINYTHTFDVSALPGSPVLDYAGSIGNTQVSPEMAHPHWKANTAFGYLIGPVTTTLHWRYIAAMKHQDVVVDPTSTTPGVGTYNYFDFDAHWAVVEHLELTAGLTNIGNKNPPFVSGQPLTTDTATYDIIGRTYYVGFKSKF